jgi:probable O-glycosylation ligase (exosortase A-associated)
LALVWLLIDSREKLFYLVVTIALSIGLVTVKGGYWAVMTGFHDRVYGPPGSQFAENNQFAVAVAMTIPLLMIWLRETKDRPLRWAIMALIGLSYVSALSTWSRGGLLSLAAVTVLLVWYSKRKYLAIPFVVLGVVLATATFPEKWSGRMQSILTFQDDASAQSRIEKWEIGWATVLDRPVTGAGFEAWPILSATKGGIGDWHSAYVEILAESGFVGLGIWGGILLGTLFGLGRLARLGKRDVPWVGTYAGMLQASLLGYMAGGLTLGIAYWELMFWVVVCVAVTARIAKQTQPAAL